MASSQPSATGTIKRKLAVFTVALVGVSIIVHFAIPWIDMIQSLGWLVGFAWEYPIAAAIPVAFLVLFFIMAAVDDHFSP